MTALKKGWEEYWFTPASPFPIAGLRIFSCLFLFYYFGYFHTFNPDLAGVSEAFWNPQTFFRWIDRDFLLPEVFVWTRWLILTFAFTALVGIKTRLSLISLFFLLLFHFGFEVNFYKPRQYEVTTVYVFFFLALSRCFDVWSVDARLRSKHQAQTGEKPPIPAASWRYQWPIRAIAAAICYLYISAGFVKLAKSGTAWFLTDNLAFVFVFLDHPPGVWLGQNYPQLCRWLAFLTLIFGVLYKTPLGTTFIYTKCYVSFQCGHPVWSGIFRFCHLSCFSSGLVLATAETLG